MKTKRFTLLQLFSLIDGRLSTNMKDIYEMLDWLFDNMHQTIELPRSMDKLNEANPEWFRKASAEIDRIKKIHGNQFNFVIAHLSLHQDTLYFDVPQIEAH